MTDTAPVFITNQFTHLEKSSEDLRLSGKVYTDLGLISEAYLMLSDKKNNLFFIRPIDFTIDFETDEALHAFNYFSKLDLDQMSDKMFKQGIFETQFEIELRIQFKNEEPPCIAALTSSSDLNKNNIDVTITKKHGRKTIYFSFHIDEEGFVFLTVDYYEKETAVFLQERTSVLSFSHPLLLNKNIWVMGGYSPRLESINTWSFFKFLQENHTEIRSYYILSEDAPHYEEAVERYGDAILTYRSHNYITTLIRSTVLMTSGCLQLFYPVLSTAYHKKLKAKKILMPGSMLGTSNHPYTFNQKSGHSPVDFIITHSEEEAEFVNLHLNYEGDRILITGTPLADKFLEQDMQVREKQSILMLPCQSRQPVKSNEFSAAAYHLSLLKNPIFKDFIQHYELKPIIALPPAELAHFQNDFINEDIMVLEQTEENILASFYYSMLVISNYHPMVTLFALRGRPIAAYEPWNINDRQSFPSESLPLGELCRTPEDLMILLDEIAETGFLSKANLQLMPEKLVEFKDDQSNHRIFEILVEQL